MPREAEISSRLRYGEQSDPSHSSASQPGRAYCAATCVPRAPEGSRTLNPSVPPLICPRLEASGHFRERDHEQAGLVPNTLD
jgi:hypothetical protein